MQRRPGSSPGAGTPPLLEFERVTKGYPDGRQQIVVLDRVSFAVHAGDFVGVLGSRLTGKSTLLRLAAGIEGPDAGTVRLEGRDFARLPVRERDRLLRTRIGLLATEDNYPQEGERAVDLVALPLVSDGATLQEARSQARRMLDWSGAAEYADELAGELSVGERTRVMLALALVREPRLLLVDEPAVAPTLAERDELCALLRAGARERGAALVIASQDRASLRGAGVLMTIGDGELCSTGEPGVVLPFRGRQTGGAERPRS
jgi:ABC-type lipoprotein export system ATPase subunit